MKEETMRINNDGDSSILRRNRAWVANELQHDELNEE